MAITQELLNQACEVLPYFSINQKSETQWIISAPSRETKDIDRKVWQGVRHLLKGLGGTWQGGKTQGFIFEFNPDVYFRELKKGKVVNLKSFQQYFPTPELVCSEYLFSAISPATVHEDTRFLEPHAGAGSILKAFKKVIGPEFEDKGMSYLFHAIERDPFRRVLLKDIPNTLVRSTPNYLEQVWPEGFDCILMNPPFAGKPYFKGSDPSDWFTQDPHEYPENCDEAAGSDMEHLFKSLLDLSDAGVVSTILSTGWLTNSSSRYAKIREVLDVDSQEALEYFSRGSSALLSFTWMGCKYEGEMIEIPRNAFKESGTTVSTIHLYLYKFGTVFPDRVNTPFNAVKTSEYGSLLSQ